MQKRVSKKWMEIMSIKKGGGGVRRLMENSILNFHSVFLNTSLTLKRFHSSQVQFLFHHFVSFLWRFVTEDCAASLPVTVTAWLLNE